jgi:hypothetical protein
MASSPARETMPSMFSATAIEVRAALEPVTPDTFIVDLS